MTNRWQLLVLLVHPFVVQGAISSTSTCRTSSSIGSENTSGSTGCSATSLSAYEPSALANASITFGVDALNANIVVFARQPGGYPLLASGDASATAAYSLTDRVIFFGSNSILWQLSGGYSRGYAALGGGSFTVGGIQSILTDNGGPSPYFFFTPSGVPLDLSLSLMISAYATAIIGSTSGGVSYNISTSGRNNISSPDIPITFASKNGYAYNVYLGTQIPWDPAFDPPPPVATPEPSTWFLIASAILLMALIGRRQRSSFFKSY